MTRVKYTFNSETVSYHSKPLVGDGQVVVANIYVTQKNAVSADSFTAVVTNYDTGLEVETTEYNTLAKAKKGLKSMLTTLGVAFQPEARIRRTQTVLTQNVA
jgi:hypothetical protein